ncbi:MAG TPA: MFS transporter, partial [Longimicrobiaceae bacterium]|nr:MFS transporter [Longimicrobiaceae bacterium]
VERRAPDPIIDLRLFLRNRTIGRATLTMFLLGATFLFTIIFLPLYLVNVVGISVTSAGLSLTPLTLAMVGTSITAGRLASRLHRVRGILVGSLVLLAASFAIMAFTLTADSTQAEVTWKMVLIGLGMGPTLPLYTLVVQNAARRNQLGVVTAGSIFARAVGQVLGLALFGTLFAATLTSAIASRTQSVLSELPAASRTALATALPTVGGGGEGTAVRFDADEILAGAARAGPDLSAADLGSVVTAVDQLERAFAESLTRAITTLYWIGTVLVLLALGMTLLIPRHQAGLIPRHQAGP